MLAVVTVLVVSGSVGSGKSAGGVGVGVCPSTGGALVIAGGEETSAGEVCEGDSAATRGSTAARPTMMKKERSVVFIRASFLFALFAQAFKDIVASTVGTRVGVSRGAGSGIGGVDLGLG